MRVLSMKAKWLKHEWFWKVRRCFLLAFGIGLIAIPLIVALALFKEFNSDGKAGLIIGASCGLVGSYGLNIIIELIYYAIRRIKLGERLQGISKKGN